MFIYLRKNKASLSNALALLVFLNIIGQSSNRFFSTADSSLVKNVLCSTSVDRNSSAKDNKKEVAEADHCFLCILNESDEFLAHKECCDFRQGPLLIVLEENFTKLALLSNYTFESRAPPLIN